MGSITTQPLQLGLVLGHHLHLTLNIWLLLVAVAVAIHLLVVEALVECFLVLALQYLPAPLTL
jgi:hypothetical protein